MTTTYDWREFREATIHRFNGDTPNADQEQTVLEHFTENPLRVAVLADAIAAKVEAGKVRSGWEILRRELAATPADIQVTDTGEKLKQRRLAETWIRNTGGHCDRQEEVESELFDESRGRLRHWPELRQQMVALWFEQRPKFLATELESEKRQREHADRQLRLRKASRGALTPQQADEHAMRIAAEVQRAKEAFERALEEDRPWD